MKKPTTTFNDLADFFPIQSTVILKDSSIKNLIAHSTPCYQLLCQHAHPFACRKWAKPVLYQKEIGVCLDFRAQKIFASKFSAYIFLDYRNGIIFYMKPFYYIYTSLF